MSGARKEAVTTLPQEIPKEEEPSKREGLEEWMVDETEEEEQQEDQPGSSHTDGKTRRVTDTLTFLSYLN